jgi:alkanesulfonate monooxygenase SsuD/methylene tetrahydromethanopterin reductase-like flavin-dependent oxidoreductase (luciferase family)
VRDRIPIYLAAVGPRNVALAGEIADGWLAIFFSAQHGGESLAAVVEGRRRSGATMQGFDVVATMPLVVGDDVAAAADEVRAYAALYLGGMGSRDTNFYNALARRMGYEQAAGQIQDAYLARDYRGAAAAVPQQFLDDTALLGPVERLAERMSALAAAGVTTLSVIPFAASAPARLAALRTAVTALELSGAAP